MRSFARRPPSASATHTRPGSRSTPRPGRVVQGAEDLKRADRRPRSGSSRPASSAGSRRTRRPGTAAARKVDDPVRSRDRSVRAVRNARATRNVVYVLPAVPPGALRVPAVRVAERFERGGHAVRPVGGGFGQHVRPAAEADQEHADQEGEQIDHAGRPGQPGRGGSWRPDRRFRTPVLAGRRGPAGRSRCSTGRTRPRGRRTRRRGSAGPAPRPRAGAGSRPAAGPRRRSVGRSVVAGTVRPTVFRPTRSKWGCPPAIVSVRIARQGRRDRSYVRGGPMSMSSSAPQPGPVLPCPGASPWPPCRCC